MFLAILGMLDIITGICLAITLKNSIVNIIATVVLIKGIFSFIGSFATKHFLDWMGFIDLIAGICLLVGFYIPYFWIFPILKGAYSFLTGF